MLARQPDLHQIVHCDETGHAPLGVNSLHFSLASINSRPQKGMSFCVLFLSLPEVFFDTQDWIKAQICSIYSIESISCILILTAAAKSFQSCPTLCNPIDGSPPGSPSLGFSRQEHWSGWSFPSPVHESEINWLYSNTK